MTKIICLGNDLRGDDGAGPAVAVLLRELGVPALVEQPANLIDAWEDAADVVVVDTVDSGAPPGTVHRIDAGEQPVPVVLRSGSTHLLGLADVIELARTLGRLPPRLHIVGIEGRAYGYGDPLSAEVERTVEQVATELARSEGPPGPTQLV